MYNVINIQTKQVVGIRKTRKAASRLVDKLDNQHGGYIHTITEVAVMHPGLLYHFQGVCKECGNGTLDNRSNPAFELEDDNEGDGGQITCMSCHSRHVDGYAF